MERIKFEDRGFPEKLRKIENPPNEIYVEGNKEILNNNLIAVIGSRSNTAYGKKWCEKICKDLLEANLNIVSGMAIGIDSIAHKSSIMADVPTVAVLPSGLDNIYPMENIELYNKIISKGGVAISEYKPQTKASYNKFIERNRIVAGLSIGVLVVEAAYRSGTSITAGIARSHKKPVFCIPGDLENPKSVGTNRLIQEGAILVTSAEDIISKYDFLHKVKERKRKKKLKTEEKKDAKEKERIVDGRYGAIYELIPYEGINVNDIVSLNKLNLSQVMEAITMLEVMGKIKREAGNKYSRT